MKKVLLATFVLSFFSLNNLFAQGIAVINVSVADTTDMNTVLPVTYTLKNTDLINSITVDSLEVKVTANGTAINNLLTLSGPFPFTPGGTYTISSGANIDVTPTAFFLGDNVVVIWPVADGITGISNTDTIFVREPNFISSPDLSSKLFITSTTVNQFQIVNHTQSEIYQLNIFDLNGRLIEQYSGDKKQFKLDNISSGIYLLEIKLSDGKKAIFKIAVQ